MFLRQLKGPWNTRKFTLQQWMKINSLISHGNRFFWTFFAFLWANEVDIFFKLLILSPESMLLLRVIDVEVSFKG